MSEQSPALGHNSGGIDLSLALEPVQLRADLAADTAALLTRRDELLVAFDRFNDLTKDGIPDEATQGRAGDFVRQLAAHIATADARRTVIKAPVLEAQRLIDGYFKTELADPLATARTAVLAKVTTFLRKQEAAAAEKRRAEAERARADAARLAAHAEATRNEAMMDRAIEAEAAAEAVAAAPAAAPERVRSDLGTVVSVRKGPWQVRVTDISKVPPQFLMPNTAMLLTVPKSDRTVEEGAQPIPGIEFYRETKASIR